MFFALALLIFPPPVLTAQADEDRVLFFCRIGDRRVDITRDGERMTLRFGNSVLTADPAAATLFQQTIPIVYGQGHILRFRDGARSIAIYSFYEVDVGGRNREQEEAGVLILHGSRIVQRQKCRHTGWRDDLDYDPFEGNWRYVIDYDALPAEPLDLYSSLYKPLRREPKPGS